MTTENHDLTYEGILLAIEYTIDRDVHYGVEGSPVWDEIEIQGVKVGGVDIIPLIDEAIMAGITDQLREEIRDD